MSGAVPALAGVLSAAEVRGTADAVASLQQRDGAIPWVEGGQVDVWNHVESAMGLLVAGHVEAANRAYDWVLATQRADGSWPMRVVGDVVEDASGETNMAAYLAVGVWHHWLVERDEVFVRRTWPTVRRGLDWVVALQRPWGGVAWSVQADGLVNDGALLAGSSSVHHALRAGVALAELVGQPQPEWEVAAGRLGHALRRHREQFLDKSTYSMDWYYPVLGGAVRGPAAVRLLEERWDDFVVPGLGVRCVSTNPWVTAAETCELVMALAAIGERERALCLLRDVAHLRADSGGYWTGYVYEDETIWPREQTSWTGAAVILAVDALSHTTPGADIMRGATLPGDLPVGDLACGCPLDARQRVSA